MCGELDEDVHLDSEVLERFLAIAGHHGGVPGEPSAGVPDLAEPSGRAGYMDALFTAGLTRAVTDARAAAEGQRVDAIASQAIAFARLAGFLAGQLPAEADLFRAAIEAITDGHAMPRRAAEEIRASHDHHHHHHHHGAHEGHGHGH